ncbi:hypothetical protein FA95DRAFT_1361007 [Auriscalpium vulgare]|uniref:Uncharacterized protein n=1 Tax=Auriscalpium vulgare TaxID=40419 RepID=A0ACB8RQJ8_9AGAM|nr:hypothetical protein FA95DRAFT_1361007 [Auriscalpium vulgare]
MDRAPEADDNDRADQFFDLLSTTETVEPLIQFAMTHSLRKMNVRLSKLRRSVVDALEDYRILYFVHRQVSRRKGEADLRNRGRELLPSVRELIGVAPGAVVRYDAVLRYLRDRIPSTGDALPALPTSADVERFLHICTLVEFLLNTRFVSRIARIAPTALTLLERRMYKVAVYAMGATRLVSACGSSLKDVSAEWAHTPDDESNDETAQLVPVEIPTLDLDLERFWSQSQSARKRACGAMRDLWKTKAETVLHPEARLIYLCNEYDLFPLMPGRWADVSPPPPFRAGRDVDAADPSSVARGGVFISCTKSPCVHCLTLARAQGLRLTLLDSCPRIDSAWRFVQGPSQRNAEDLVAADAFDSISWLLHDDWTRTMFRCGMGKRMKRPGKVRTQWPIKVRHDIPLVDFALTEKSRSGRKTATPRSPCYPRFRSTKTECRSIVSPSYFSDLFYV